MTEFSTRAQLEVEVDKKSLRDARKTIEAGTPSVRARTSPGARSDGGKRRATHQEKQLLKGQAMSRNIMTAQLDQLVEIKEVLEKQATSEGGGGGDGGGLPSIVSGTGALIGGSALALGAGSLGGMEARKKLTGAGLGNIAELTKLLESKPGGPGTLGGPTRIPSRSASMGAFFGVKASQELFGKEQTNQAVKQLDQAIGQLSEPPKWLPQLEAASIDQPPWLQDLQQPRIQAPSWLPDLQQPQISEPGWMGDLGSFEFQQPEWLQNPQIRFQAPSWVQDLLNLFGAGGGTGMGRGDRGRRSGPALRGGGGGNQSPFQINFTNQFDLAVGQLERTIQQELDRLQEDVRRDVEDWLTQQLDIGGL